jgi:hypothetical protein
MMSLLSVYDARLIAANVVSISVDRLRLGGCSDHRADVAFGGENRLTRLGKTPEARRETARGLAP